MPARLRTIAWLTALLCGAAVLATVAAQAPAQTPFRGGIDLVSLNVTVTRRPALRDRSRRG